MDHVGQPRILVLCTGNRARSQMAEGWLRHLGAGRIEVHSAGTHPKGVHPKAIEVMREVGIDLSGHESKHLDRFLDQDFDLVITVCDSAREACPAFPRAKRLLHRSIPDPDVAASDEELTNVFRRTRDEIGELAREVIAQVAPNGA